MRLILLVLSCALVLCVSCERHERLAMKGTDEYQVTNEYLPLPDKLEPPYLYNIGWLLLGEIYHIEWNDRAIIATRHPAKEPFHEYYVIYARDSILTGSSRTDIVSGPLTERQRDSVLSLYRIDLSGMKTLDFN